MVPTLLDRKRVCLQCVCVGRRPCTSMESEINKWIIREDELYMSGCTVCLSVSAQWGRFGTSFTPRSPDQSHLCVCLCRSRRSTTKTCSTQLWSCIDLACRQRWMPLLLLVLSFCSHWCYLSFWSSFCFTWQQNIFLNDLVCSGVYSWLMLHASLNKTTTSWH